MWICARLVWMCHWIDCVPPVKEQATALWGVGPMDLSMSRHHLNLEDLAERTLKVNCLKYCWESEDTRMMPSAQAFLLGAPFTCSSYPTSVGPRDQGPGHSHSSAVSSRKVPTLSPGLHSSWPLVVIEFHRTRTCKPLSIVQAPS